MFRSAKILYILALDIQQHKYNVENQYRIGITQLKEEIKARKLPVQLPQQLNNIGEVR